jgi:hypothetical protein
MRFLFKGKENSMAKDDYHVIVYRILSYLYTRLKAGEPTDGRMISADSKYFRINERYWEYIIKALVNQGFISGVTISKTWGNDVIINGLDYAQITPAGIEYLCDNSFMKRQRDY